MRQLRMAAEPSEETLGPLGGWSSVVGPASLMLVRDGAEDEGVTEEPAVDSRQRLAALYREHAAMVFRLGLRYGGGDRAWAEDIVQEVFFEVLGHVDRIARMDNPSGWIYRATTSRCLNRLRDRRRRASPPVRAAIETHLYAVTGSVEAQGEARARLARLFDRVSELPPKQRVCFWMYHCDGRSQEEIGEVLGHSKGYVSKLLQRALDAVEGGTQ